MNKKKPKSIKTIFHTIRFAGYQVLQKILSLGMSKDLVSLKESSITVAFICDEMTWHSFSPLCNAIYVTPYNAKRILKHYRPACLFCESCWHGVRPYTEVWRSRIYRNHYILYDNRRSLLKTIRLFRLQGIPTVFWDKEDPAYLHSLNYDFISTALKFDYVFSTSTECVEFYKKKGHPHSDLLPFGFLPTIFNPLNRSSANMNAVFAGSWYPEHMQRCMDFRKICTCLLEKGVHIDVYDRNSKNGQTNFPNDLSLNVYSAVAYKNLGEKYRLASIGIVLNTITNSETMFARRFVEMAACGMALISNESPGLRKQFLDSVFFVDGKTPYKFPTKEAIHQNVRKAFLEHTVYNRWHFLLSVLGICTPQQPRILVFTDLDISSQFGTDSTVQVFARSELMCIKTQKDDLGIILTQRDISEQELLFWRTQFTFLPQPCAVGQAGKRYQLNISKSCENLLMPLNILQNMEDGSVKCIQAYCA